MNAIEPVIYGLIDPRTNKIRYVGQSVDVARRYAQHCEFIDSTPKGLWVQELRLASLTPRLVILEKVESRNRLNYSEKWWMALGSKQGWNLINVAIPTKERVGFDEFFKSTLSSIYSDYDMLEKPLFSIHKFTVVFVLSVLAGASTFLLFLDFPVGANMLSQTSVWVVVSILVTLGTLIAYARSYKIYFYLAANFPLMALAAFKVMEMVAL